MAFFENNTDNRVIDTINDFKKEPGSCIHYLENENNLSTNTKFVIIWKGFPRFSQADLMKYPNIRVITFDKTFVDSPQFADEKQINYLLLKELECNIEAIRGFMSSILRSYRSLVQKNLETISPISTTNFEYPFLHFQYFLDKKIIHKPNHKLYFAAVYSEFSKWVGPSNLQNIVNKNLFDFMVGYLLKNASKYNSVKQVTDTNVNQKEWSFMDLEILNHRKI